MKLVVVSDEKTHLANSVVSYLKKKGHELTLLGDLIDKKKRWKWVDIGKKAAEKVAKEIIDAFLSTKFNEEDLNQAHKLDKL